MDFVVVGFGLGAIMMLVGFGLRDLGPWLFGSNVSSRSLPEFETVKATIRKQTLASIGTGIATAGTGLALVTLAALLARTEDELGTIVVGMSLALAAVGVGAWTYDAIRRYRAAMDMVTSQEQSILARLSPEGARSLARPNRPTSTIPVVEREETAYSNDDEQRTHSDSDEADEAGLRTPESVTEDTGIEGSLELTSQPAASSSDVPAEQPESNGSMSEVPTVAADGPSEATYKNQSAFPDSARKTAPSAPASSLPRVEVERGPRVPQDETSGLRWPKLNRTPEKQQPEPPIEDDFTNLPPLPEEHDDALIAESVRFDFKSDGARSVPSWLFEDLDKELAGPGKAATEDPIDQFRTSQPRQRGSALDRILANEDENEPDFSEGVESDEESRPATTRKKREDS